MRYLHTMVRVRDLEANLRFFRDGLGLRETRRMENPQGRYTVSYTHLRAHETVLDLVCRLLLAKKHNNITLFIYFFRSCHL